jgi:mannose-1-phosphate guanylyltransferase
MKIIVRAGGTGTRLWPLSREEKPKQLHSLTCNFSMLKDTLERLKGLAKPQDIFISTNEKCLKEAQKDLKRIPKRNIILEPARKDTAGAIGLESIYLRKLAGPNAIVASIGSDHVVRNKPEFQRILRIAEKALKKYPDCILPIGLKAVYPHTGYGYIELEKKLTTIDSQAIFKVKSFKEKPDLPTAQKFVASKKYLWNGNIFVWRISTILDLYRKHLPQMYAQLEKIESAIGTKKEKQVLKKVYPQIEKVAVDPAIVEKTKKIIAIEADIGWNDIGDWKTLKEELEPNQQKNYIKAKNHIDVDSSNCIVFQEKSTSQLIATVGLKDIAIIDTPKAILICHQKEAQKVKKIVEALEKNKKLKKYL